MADVSMTVLAATEAAEEGGTSNFLIPNGTFIFELIIFLIVLGVIGKWVVPPIMKVLNEREAMIKQTAEDNRKSAEKFTAAQEDYEAAMATARGEASGIRDEARAEGRAILNDMRGRAGQEAESTLQQASEELEQQSDVISSDLRSSVDTLSTTLADRVLGVQISEATTTPAATSALGR